MNNSTWWIHPLGYTTQVKVDSLQTSFILPYLKPYLMIKKLEGTCSLTMTIDGNMNDPYRSVMRGQVDLRDFDERQLDKLIQVLTEKPQLVIDFQYFAYSEKDDSIHHDIKAKPFEKWNHLIRDYLTPFLDDPANRFSFSVKEKSGTDESSKKSEKKALCYELDYTVRK